MLVIRPELPEDIPAIRLVNEQAFGQPLEADLVDSLRASGCDQISLVAEESILLVGHVLFTPAVIESPRGPVVGMGLAPVAVLPEFQNRGIGSKLIEAGLDLIRERSYPFVIVLGHPEYYPRFGFETAAKHGLRSQWEGVPDEAFMVLILDAAAMEGVSGVARYRPEFDATM